MAETYIRASTGEVVEIASYRTPEQAEAYKEIGKLTEGRTKSHAFTFSDMNNAQEVIQMLTTIELGYFLVLQTYIDYDNNALIVSTHNPVPMSKGQIAEALGIANRSMVKKNIDTFIEKGLLIEKTLVYKGKQYNAYCVNEKYHFKGKTNNKAVAKSFSTQIRNIYKSNLSKRGNKQPSDLGFMYMMLPYIHYDLNVLCSNPFEKDAQNIQPLSLTELCELTGVDKKRMQNKLVNLKWDGMTGLGAIKHI